MRKKSFRSHLAVILFIALIVVFGSGINAFAKSSEPVEEELNPIYYRGVANDYVNVRTGPGLEFDRVSIDDEFVRLKAGDNVVIIGEEEATTGILWYKIMLDHEGTQVVGYSTSTYVAKMEPVEKAKEEPTPEPTPDPVPEPVEEPEPSPTPAAVTEAEPEEKQEGLGWYIYVIVVLVIVIAVLAVIVFINFRTRKKRKDSPVHAKLDELRNMKVRSITPKNRKDSREELPEKKRPIIKKSGKVSTPAVSNLKTKSVSVPTEDAKETAAKDVLSAAKAKTSSEVQLDPEDDVPEIVVPIGGGEKQKIIISAESEERKMLREDIENLREHDIVMHKIFGEGEVYDNSDVRLIEIRFDGDARFLNKDQIAAKQMLEINADGRIYTRRKNSSMRSGSIRRNIGRDDSLF